MDPRLYAECTTVGLGETTPTRCQSFPSRCQPSSGFLTGALTESTIVVANSGKRRAYGPSLLSSPARCGHSPKMANIFHAARATLVTKAVSRPFIPRTNGPHVHNGEDQANQEGEVSCPIAPEIPSKPASTMQFREKADPFVFAATLESPVGNLAFNDSRPLLKSVVEIQSPIPQAYIELPQSVETIKPNTFKRMPNRPSQPMLVSMNEIDSIQSAPCFYSSSSASWTGDSEFYHPKQRVIPLDQRKSNVPDWLAKLPAEPEGYERDGEDTFPPLSPGVQVERGSMRRRYREREVRQRCASYNDDDIFD